MPCLELQSRYLCMCHASCHQSRQLRGVTSAIHAQHEGQISRDACMRDQASTKQRLWRGFTGVRGAKISRVRLIKQLESAQRRMTRVERRIGTSLAVPCCRGQDMLSCDLRRVFQSCVRLSNPGRERRAFVAEVVRDRSAGRCQSLTQNSQVGYSTRDIMRVICPCVHEPLRRTGLGTDRPSSRCSD